MKPYKHAQSSAVKYGGTPEDYLAIHDYMDSSKAACADVRHRAIFHSAFGIFIVEAVFGTNITNSIGKKVSVRDIAEQHVQEDLGFIPSIEHWVKNMPIEPWMMGKGNSTKRHIPMEEKVSPSVSVTEVDDGTPRPGSWLISPGVNPVEIDGTNITLDGAAEIWYNEANTDGVRPAPPVDIFPRNDHSINPSVYDTGKLNK